MKPFLKVRWIALVIVIAMTLIAVFVATRPGKDGSSATVSFSVGKTETRNNMSSAMTSSTSDHSTFTPRRLVFVQTDSGRFGERISDLVVRGLTNCPLIEHVEVVKASTLTNVFQSPDLFVRLNVVDLDRSGILSSTIKASVEGSFGTSPWQSTHYSISRETPPVVQFAWNGWIENESTFSGLRTDRYAESAKSIAEAFVKGVSNEVVKLAEKYPTLPELPAVFYGPYQPVGDFNFLKELNAKRICSYYGLFMHNETFWEFQTATNPLPQLQRIVDQLVASGWKMGEVSLTNTYPEMIQARQGDGSVEIFREHEPVFGQTKKITSTRFVMRYQKPFSNAEVEAALETLFAEQRPLEMLVPFQNAFSSKQRERFHAMLEKTPATDPFTCVSLAEVYFGRKETNTAINMLLRAKALRVALKDESALTSRIDSLAKQISPKKELKLEVTPEVCRQARFLEFTNDTQRFEVEGEFGKPVLWFSESKRGVVISALTLRAPRGGICNWTFSYTIDGGRGSQWSSFDVKQKGPWRQMVSANDDDVFVTARLLPDGKRIAFVLEGRR